MYAALHVKAAKNNLYSEEVFMEANDIMAEVVVELLLEKDNKFLLQERANTNYEDGKYGFVGGHVARGETLKQAMIREAKEEAGIGLKEEDLDCVFVANKTGNKNCINFVFKAKDFSGTPKNMEEDKCTDLSWFEPHNLPENMIDLERRVIRRFVYR